MLSNQRIAGFDGIRALAVILVVLQHLGIWESAGQPGLVKERLSLLLSGGTGVQAFFILSGFLITILLIKEKEATGKVSIGNFMIRRSLRILPLYIFCCVLTTLALGYFNNYVPWRSLSYAFLYVYNFVPVENYVNVLGHTWSLAVEEHFYLVWPVVFAASFKRGRKGLVIGLAAFVVSSLVLHFLLLRQPFAQEYFISRWSFIAGSSIAFGCIGALLISARRDGIVNPEFFARRSVLLVGIVLFLNSLYVGAGSWFIQNVVSGYVRSAGLLLIILWIYKNQRAAVVRLLETPLLRYIGTISYGIYMWQGFFLSTGPKRLPGEFWPPNQYVGLLMLVIVAPLSFRYFEQPFLRLKDRLMRSSSLRSPRVT
jgi:peptidoglycan/LPS O-acetylase OafA/YrhL